MINSNMWYLFDENVIGLTFGVTKLIDELIQYALN